MTRRVARALPVGAAPVQWRLTMQQGRDAASVQPGPAFEADETPDPVSPSVSWTNGFGWEYADGEIEQFPDDYQDDTILLGTGGELFVVTYRSGLVFDAPAGAAITWTIAFEESAAGDLHPDWQAIGPLLVVAYVNIGSSYKQGVYTITPAIDGEPQTPLTMTAALM